MTFTEVKPDQSVPQNVTGHGGNVADRSRTSKFQSTVQIMTCPDLYSPVERMRHELQVRRDRYLAEDLEQIRARGGKAYVDDVFDRFGDHVDDRFRDLSENAEVRRWLSGMYRKMEVTRRMALSRAAKRTNLGLACPLEDWGPTPRSWVSVEAARPPTGTSIEAYVKTLAGRAGEARGEHDNRQALAVGTSRGLILGFVALLLSFILFLVLAFPLHVTSGPALAAPFLVGFSASLFTMIDASFPIRGTPNTRRRDRDWPEFT